MSIAWRRMRPSRLRPVARGRSALTRRGAVAILLAAMPMLALALPATPAPAATQGQVQAQIDRLASEIADLDEAYNQASIHLQSVQTQIADSKAQSAKAESDFLALQKVASAQAAAIYRAGAPSLLIAFLSSKNLDDFNKKMELISQVSDWQSGIMTSLQIASERSRHATADLDHELAQARAISDSLARQRAVLTDRLASEQKLLGQITAENRAAALRAAEARAAAVRAALVATRSGGTSPASLPPLPSSGSAAIALRAAMAQIGKPYQWAGSGPASFDCSGLTMSSWGAAGVSMPHSAAAQYSSFKHVSIAQLQPGDLVFFGSPIHHVGMYVGGGMMIHAPETGELVQVSPMSRGDLVGAARPGV